MKPSEAKVLQTGTLVAWSGWDAGCGEVVNVHVEGPRTVYVDVKDVNGFARRVRAEYARLPTADDLDRHAADIDRKAAKDVFDAEVQRVSNAMGKQVDVDQLYRQAPTNYSVRLNRAEILALVERLERCECARSRAGGYHE